MTMKKMKKKIPDIEIITLARVVAHFNVDMWGDGWSQSYANFPEEHLTALAYFQAHFKNHLMDIQGLKTM